MSVDHRVVWTDPRLVLETSGVERRLIDPDEPGLSFDQSFEVAGEDNPVPHNIISMSLREPLLRLAKSIEQVIVKDRPELADIHSLALWVLLKEMVLDQGQGLHVTLEVLER